MDANALDQRKKDVMPPLLLTVRQAARELGLSRSTIYSLISTGELASIKIGRSRRIPWEAVVAFVATYRG